MASLGAFLNLQRRPTAGSLRSLLDVEIPVEQEVNILAQAAEERQKQDEAGPNLRPANPMQSILEGEKFGAFNALQNIPISPLASAVELASPGAYDAMTAPVEGANPEVPNMLAGLDQMSLGGLVDTPVAAGLLRTKAPSMKAPIPARLRGRPTGSLGDLAAAEPAAAPPFYSQARTVLEDPKTQGTQTGEAWIKFLTDPKRGVKSEEMQYTGLGDFLKGKAGQRVTRDEIQSHLDANEIEIKEVTKGARGINPQDIQRADEEMRRTGIVMRQNRTPENVEAFNAAVERYENLKLDYTGDKRETKFSKYTLPGAENYREVLLTLPRYSGKFKAVSERLTELSKMSPEDFTRNPEMVTEFDRLTEEQGKLQPRQAFKSGHWDEEDVVAHLRLSDRTDADGKRTLLVEEIQSDWAQKGRKEGFADPEMAKVRAKYEALRNQPGGFPYRDPEAIAIRNQLGGDEALDGKAGQGVPLAPFVTDTGKWTALGLKRVLKMAADEGYDRIGIVPGVEQAKRYDLSKQIDELKWYRDGDKYRVTAMKGGSPVIQKGSLTPNELSEAVGKELADKIVAGAAEEQHGSFSGLDLAVGGEGMKGYYDKIVPDTLNKLAKEYGVKVNLEGGKVRTEEVKAIEDWRKASDGQLRELFGKLEPDLSDEEINEIGRADLEKLIMSNYSDTHPDDWGDREYVDKWGIDSRPDRPPLVDHNAITKALNKTIKEQPSGTVPVHTLDVPEPMKKQIKAKGFPLYSKNSLGGLLGAQNA